MSDRTWIVVACDACGRPQGRAFAEAGGKVAPFMCSTCHQESIPGTSAKVASIVARQRLEGSLPTSQPTDPQPT